MTVEHRYSTGILWWRKIHIDHLKFMSNNGVEWRDVTGDGVVGRAEKLADKLHKIFHEFRWPSE